MEPVKVIKVGIAGFGLSGRVFHAPFLDASDKYEIVGVYERNTSKASELYPYVKVYRSYGEMLRSGIDLVVICTPNLLHFTMAIDAMNLGVNVVLEKPITATSKEAELLEKHAREMGVIIAPFMNRRFDGDFMTVKELIGSGRMGEILDYECHFDRYKVGPITKTWKRIGGPGVNILYDLGVHLIDQAVVLFGRPKEVYADLYRQREETPEDSFDNFTVVLYYDGMKAILKAGEVVIHSGPHFRVQGTKGCYCKSGFDPQEKALGDGHRPGDNGWGQEPEELHGQLYFADSSENVPTIPGDYGRFYEELYDVLVGGRQIESTELATTEQAAEVIRILELALESNRTKKRLLV